MVEKRLITPETLESLHRWFEHLCKYNDADAPADRFYAEGQIYACREMLNEWDYRYKDMSRGLQMLDNEPFLSGYHAFQRDYTL